jgi:hypothetical protein
MKTLPENILRRLSKEDRAQGGKGFATSAEANANHEARSEREIHKQIEQWLNLHGIVYIHSRTDKRTTNAVGLPDFVFVRRCVIAACVERAVPFAIEIKLPGKEPTKEQAETMLDMKANGWTCAVAHSLKEFIEIVTG